jgi:hypothetical protein
VSTVQSISLIFPCLVFLSPVIVSGRIFARSQLSGCSGLIPVVVLSKKSSWCLRNSGPLNHSFVSFSLVTVIPLVAASAGFIGPGTQRTCISLRYCQIFNTLFFTKTSKNLDFTRSQLCTALESVHKQIVRCLTFKTVINFFAEANPFRRPIVPCVEL